jgi:hypothetical protein
MFEKIVQLYRELGRPVITRNTISYSGRISDSVKQLIEEINCFPVRYGRFADLEIDRNEVELEYQLPSSEYGRFHASIAALLNATPSLGFGELPTEYYIVDLDYCSGDVAVHSKLIALVNLCRFIRALTKLAANNATNRSAGQDENSLLFVVAADGKSPSRTLAIKTVVDADTLLFPLPHVRFLELLQSEIRKNDVHVEERLIIMRHSIAEALASITDEKKRFLHLVQHWQTIVVSYQHNFSAFIHQYSFEKVRKEIASAEIENATKMSAVLADITGKLLVLPVSLAAVVLLRKATANDEFWIGFAGVLCVAFIFHALLVNQWLQVKRLRGSFHLIFDQYDLGKLPQRLGRPISAARANAQKQYRVLICTFIFLAIISLFPVAGAVYMAFDRTSLTIINSCILIALP